MKRNVIEINKDLCVGCSLCIKACHQGAVKLVDGKATLINDSYCDGLGMCLPKCPTDAIKVVEKDTLEFDGNRKGYAKKHISPTHHGGGCPGSKAKIISPNSESNSSVQASSQLRQWPVQLNLVHPEATYLDGANLLICADCVPFAYANFHQDFLKNHVVLVGCPKLDDINYYSEKITEIIKNNDLKSVKVLKMEVPCCTGIATVTRNAVYNCGKNLPYSELTISIDGKIKF